MFWPWNLAIGWKCCRCFKLPKRVWNTFITGHMWILHQYMTDLCPLALFGTPWGPKRAYLTQNIYSLGEKLRTVLWLVGWFIFHGSKFWWFTCDPEIWWWGHLKRKTQHVKNWLHPLITSRFNQCTIHQRKQMQQRPAVSAASTGRANLSLPAAACHSRSSNQQAGLLAT